MENSKVSRLAVRIALISVTALALVFALIFFGESEYKQYDYQRKVSDKKADEYVPEMDAYMAERDYVGLYNYMTVNNISFSYDSPYREYYNVYRTTEEFINLYEYLLEMRLRTSNYDDFMKYKVKNMALSLESIYKSTSDERLDSEITSENVREYMLYLRKDTKVFLEAYLYLENADAEELSKLSENQLGVLIEEAVTNAWE